MFFNETVDAESALILQESNDLLNAAVSTLSARDSSIIWAYYWDGMTDAAIAIDLGVSQPAITKARKRIENILHAAVINSHRPALVYM